MESPVRATGDDFIRTLGVVLTKIVSDGRPEYGPISCFNSVNAPPISDYLVRIARYVNCSNECFVLALVYIDRIMRGHRFSVSALNVHRLLITAVMLAAKFSDDVYYSNSFYAQVGGIRVAEINLLEAQFLMLIKYQLFVNAHDYEKCRKGVESSSSKIYSLHYYHYHHINSHSSNQLSHHTSHTNSNSNNYTQHAVNLVHRVSPVDLVHNTNSVELGNTVDGVNLVNPVDGVNVINVGRNRGNRGIRCGKGAKGGKGVRGGVRDLASVEHDYLISREKLSLLYPFSRTESTLTVSTAASETNDEPNSRAKFDECEAFVNALEHRYRDTLKRKCSNIFPLQQQQQQLYNHC